MATPWGCHVANGENRRTRQRLRKLWEQGNLAQLTELCSEHGVSLSTVSNVLRVHTGWSRSDGTSNSAVSQIMADTYYSKSQVDRSHTVLERAGALRTVKRAVSAGRNGGRGMAAVRLLLFLPVAATYTETLARDPGPDPFAGAVDNPPESDPTPEMGTREMANGYAPTQTPPEKNDLQAVHLSSVTGLHSGSLESAEGVSETTPTGPPAHELEALARKVYRANYDAPKPRTGSKPDANTVHKQVAELANNTTWAEIITTVLQGEPGLEPVLVQALLSKVRDERVSDPIWQQLEQALDRSRKRGESAA
jgi:hypothetical protein